MTDTDGTDLELAFSRDDDQHSYLARVGTDIVGRIDTELRTDETGRSSQIAFLHTETDPQRQGQGIAGRLTRYALGDVRDRGLRLIPVCSYTQKFVGDHPEYRDLLG